MMSKSDEAMKLWGLALSRLYQDITFDAVATVITRKDLKETGAQDDDVEGLLAQQAERLRPTVVVMDVRLPDRSGIEACREIRAAAPDTRVIMLTSYADDEAVFASILAGASGYLLKQAGGLDLVRAIERVADGQSLLDPGVTEKVLEKVKRLASGQPDEVTSLSPQEQRVLALVAEGKTNKEIATALGLSDKTVKNYLSNVFDKLHLSRRAEAAAFFARRRPAG